MEAAAEEPAVAVAYGHDGEAVLLQGAHQFRAGVVDEDGVGPGGQDVEVDVGAGEDQVVIVVAGEVVALRGRGDDQVPGAQGLGQLLGDRAGAHEQGAGAQGQDHAVDVAVAEAVHAVYPEAAFEVAFEPVAGQGVVGGGDVDDHVAAQAQDLGAVEHHLQAHVVRGRVRVGDGFGGAAERALAGVGQVEGGVGHQRAGHDGPACALLEVPLEDGGEELRLEVAGADHRRGLDDLVTGDQGVVADVERGHHGGGPGRGADLCRGGVDGDRAVDGDGERGEGRGDALDVLGQLVYVPLLDRDAAAAAGAGPAGGGEAGVVPLGAGGGGVVLGDVVVEEQVEGQLPFVGGVVECRSDDHLLEGRPLVEAVQRHRGSSVGRAGARGTRGRSACRTRVGHTASAARGAAGRAPPRGPARFRPGPRADGRGGGVGRSSVAAAPAAWGSAGRRGGRARVPGPCVRGGAAPGLSQSRRSGRAVRAVAGAGPRRRGRRPSGRGRR